MPTELWFEEWRDEKAGTLYPFADGCSLIALGSAIALRPGMFTDATLYPIGGEARLAVTEIEVASVRSVTVRFGVPGRSGIASCSFDPSLPPSSLPVIDSYGRPAGLLLCDPQELGASQAWPVGTYAFPAGTAEFVASCCIPIPSDHVQGFLLPDGTVVSGDVWLVGDGGIVLTATADNQIRVDITGEPLHARLLCGVAGVYDPPSLIKRLRITGDTGSAAVPPDHHGNFDVQVGTGVVPDPAFRATMINGALILKAVGQSIRGE